MSHLVGSRYILRMRKAPLLRAGTELSSLPPGGQLFFTVLFPTLFIFSFYFFPLLSFAPCSAAALLAFSPPSLATLAADRREELGLLPAPL